MSEATTQRIALNGIEVGYATHGVTPGKPPLLFVHGYAMRSTGPLYGDLLAQLAENYSVYALDLRGHGASADAIADWSFESVSDDIAAFVAALGLERPLFVGHSFGAIVGLFTQLRHPDTFAAFVLLSPGPADHRRDPVDALKFMIEHGRNRDALRPAFAGMFAHQPAPLLEAALDATVLLHPDVHRALQAANPRFSIDDRLGQITAPTVLICGEADTVVPPALQHDLAGKLPNCRKIVFPVEGHMLPIERPDLAAEQTQLFRQLHPGDDRS